MEDRHIQMLLAATGDYAGGIDGAFGPISTTAMLAVETRHALEYQFDPTSTTEHRRKTGCAQACLNQLEYAAGFVDGWQGVNTTEALNAFLFVVTNGREEVIDRTPSSSFSASGNIPHQNDVRTVYGDPETQVPQRLTTVRLPFKLPLDFNMRKSTNKITVHRDCAASIEAAIMLVPDFAASANFLSEASARAGSRLARVLFKASIVF